MPESIAVGAAVVAGRILYQTAFTPALFSVIPPSNLNVVSLIALVPVLLLFAGVVTVTTGAVVSTITFLVRVVVLPCTSVAVIVNVCSPSIKCPAAFPEPTVNICDQLIPEAGVTVQEV